MLSGHACAGLPRPVAGGGPAYRRGGGVTAKSTRHAGSSARDGAARTFSSRVGPLPAGADAGRQIVHHERLARPGRPFDEGHVPKRDPVSPEPEHVVGIADDVDQRHVDAHLAPRLGLKARIVPVIEIEGMPITALASISIVLFILFSYYTYYYVCCQVPVREISIFSAVRM